MLKKTNQAIIFFLVLVTISTILISIGLTPKAVLITNSNQQAISEIRIYANQDWTNTEVLVHPGDTLEIQYLSGSWSPWSGDSYDGIGSGGVPTCDCNVIFGVSHASLIGKIGDGNPFFVGNKFTQPIGQSGYLYLGINDTRLNDNSGSLLVRVNISRSTGR